MAISIGKNTAKTGINIVPRPKPEKKVKMDVRNATTQITNNSILKKFTLEHDARTIVQLNQINS
jgi:hypothetical protein